MLSFGVDNVNRITPFQPSFWRCDPGSCVATMAARSMYPSRQVDFRAQTGWIGGSCTCVPFLAPVDLDCVGSSGYRQ